MTGRSVWRFMAAVCKGSLAAFGPWACSRPPTQIDRRSRLGLMLGVSHWKPCARNPALETLCSKFCAESPRAGQRPRERLGCKLERRRVGVASEAETQAGPGIDLAATHGG